MSDTAQISRFTEKGLQGVKLKLESLRDQQFSGKGKQGTPIAEHDVKSVMEYAFDPTLIEPLTSLGTINTKQTFSDRNELGKYLVAAIADKKFSTDKGLWTWLSLIYFNQILAPSQGKYLLASEYRFIPDESRLRYYRHLVRMAWMIRLHWDERARLFLSIPCYQHTDFVEQSQKRDVFSNPNMIDLALTLFYDENEQRLKKNVANSVKSPGSYRRLVSVVSKQLFMNYDVVDMPAIKIRGVLPSEFAKWD